MNFNGLCYVPHASNAYPRLLHTSVEYTLHDIATANREVNEIILLYVGMLFCCILSMLL